MHVRAYMRRFGDAPPHLYANESTRHTFIHPSIHPFIHCLLLLITVWVDLAATGSSTAPSFTSPRPCPLLSSKLSRSHHKQLPLFPSPDPSLVFCKPSSYSALIAFALVLLLLDHVAQHHSLVTASTLLPAHICTLPLNATDPIIFTLETHEYTAIMNFTKKFDRAFQWAGEKMGQEAKTAQSEDFKSLETEMALRHEGMCQPCSLHLS